MSQSELLLGYDIGSSSVKASVLDAASGRCLASATSPSEEMKMDAPAPGWAEQHPDLWWEHVGRATATLLATEGVRADAIKAIGISYQMHGLVVVDAACNVLRPSIIWCDSRATEIGAEAFNVLGGSFCLEHYLNSPGNFTASKLKWVKEHEPDIYARIHKIMLPGDYIAGKLTGEFITTVSGLSEGIMWDYLRQAPAGALLDYYGISEALLPEVRTGFGDHGRLSAKASAELGLRAGTPVSYRAGDQPNNAFSLNVLEPGQAAATAGTSGVIYGVTDRPDYDPRSRVNTFVHVNHEPEQPRNGVLLCINGTGILNSWLRGVLSSGQPVSYDAMNQMAASAPVGSGGLRVLPFGNGAERILENRNPGAGVKGLDFNRHGAGHLLRAAQEGIVFSMRYGLDIMKQMQMDIQTVRAGHANMFLSPLFREAFVQTTGCVLDLCNTDGSQGAARGAGLGAGVYSRAEEAFEGLQVVETIEPDAASADRYEEAYQVWLGDLEQLSA